MLRSRVRSHSAPPANLLVNWMIEKFIENLVVLGGEVAVPCNLQSAIAGFNAIERLVPRWVYQASGVDVSTHCNGVAPNPVRPGKEQR